ncbi:MAG: ACP S-malonyltransferase [Actinobacteria bacterium]|nr:ACP S-malonyltransferase [Actinomycetota bacterium]
MSFGVVFPGQGSQFAGMADAWTAHPAGKAVLDEASQVLGRDIVAACRDEDLLATTVLAQPALLACDVASFRVLQAEGLSDVAAVAGHSLGEFAAMVAAGVCSLADTLGVMTVRGRAMQAAGEARPGAMAALLGVGAEAAEEICDEAREEGVLLVANENSPRQVVISGSIDAVERAEARCASLKIRTVRLNVAGAFHSPLMAPATAPLSEAIDAIAFRAPLMPIASNVTGSLVDDPEELRELSKRQVVSPVRWERCVRALAEAGVDTFVEAGPGDVLTKLAKRAAPGTRAVAVGSPEAAASLLS